MHIAINHPLLPAPRLRARCCRRYSSSSSSTTSPATSPQEWRSRCSQMTSLAKKSNWTRGNPIGSNWTSNGLLIVQLDLVKSNSTNHLSNWTRQPSNRTTTSPIGSNLIQMDPSSLKYPMQRWRFQPPSVGLETLLHPIRPSPVA